MVNHNQLAGKLIIVLRKEKISKQNALNDILRRKLLRRVISRDYERLSGRRICFVSFLIFFQRSPISVYEFEQNQINNGFISSNAFGFREIAYVCRRLFISGRYNFLAYRSPTSVQSLRPLANGSRLGK